MNSITSSGLSGLYNLGNTCYMNSILQILSHSYEFKNEIYKIKLQDNCHSKLITEWKNLISLMWTKNCIIQPNKFLKTLQNYSLSQNNELFCGYEQNDVSEFIYFLFHAFHNSCKISVDMNIKGNPKNNIDKIAIECYKSFIQNHKNDYSFVVKLCYFIQIYYNERISDSEIISSSYESNFIINLPIDSHTSNIYQCFDTYLKDTMLIGDNALMNDKTKQKEDVIRKSMFWNLPEILIICLKRFTPDGSRKENKLINFPINNLDLTKYVYTYKDKKFIYDLYGVCNHSGRLQFGHYTSFVKVTDFKNNNDKWYHFNDSNISSINENKIITSKAYCLFYRKKILN